MRPVVILLFSVAFLAAAQDAPFKYTFETSTEGWIVIGQSGAVKVSHEAKVGSGAMEYSYTLDGKGFASAILPLGAGKLSGMKRIRFWVRADHDTALGVGLSEKKPGGGDYMSMFWAPKNVWQQVELSLSDFMANDGPNDAVDSDGKLDPEQVEGIGLLDFAGFFNQLPSEAPMLVERKTGAHSILIDDFEVLTTPASNTKSAGLVDGFDRGFSEWVTFGGARLQLSASDNPIGAAALSAAMKPTEGKLVLLMKRMPAAAELAGLKRLTFDIASDHEATLAISIEVRKPGSGGGQGPRYNFLIYPPEGRKVFHVNVSLADFDHDGNSPEDPAGKLEAARIKSISIGDVTAMAGGAVAENKIWIGRMEMVNKIAEYGGPLIYCFVNNRSVLLVPLSFPNIYPD